MTLYDPSIYDPNEPPEEERREIEERIEALRQARREANGRPEPYQPRVYSIPVFRKQVEG